MHRRNTPLTHGYLPISRSRRGSRRRPTPRAACSSQRAVWWLCRAPSTSHPRRGPTWWWRRDPQSPPSSSHPHCVQGDALDSGLGGGDPCLRAAVYAFARTNCRARALSESCLRTLADGNREFQVRKKSNSPVACYKAASRLHQGEGEKHPSSLATHDARGVVVFSRSIRGQSAGRTRRIAQQAFAFARPQVGTRTTHRSSL